MIDSTMFLERILQNYRFRMVKPYLIGDVLDFGGNKGELGRLVKGDYLVVNYDYSKLGAARFDTIACFAVVEHIQITKVFEIFKQFKSALKKGGRIFLTTPTKAAKPVLGLMAFAGVIDRQNIAEHKHYWSKKEIYELSKRAGFKVSKYRKFQMGFNQPAVLERE